MWIRRQAIKHAVQCRTREQRRTVITWQSVSHVSLPQFVSTDTFHRHSQSSVLMTLPSLQSPASLYELKTLVEKKRHLKVCEENFWGMALIKQMLDIISCEIWNVFCRQAFACRARGRDTVRAAASARFCKSGIKVRCALDIAAASQVCTA